MPSARRTLPALAVVAVAMLAAAQAKTYTVTFLRPATVGERYQLVAHGETTKIEKVVIGGSIQPTPEQKVTADLDAEVEVVAVDRRGRETHIRLTIDQFIVEVTTGPGGAQANSLPKGTVVDAKIVDGDVVFSNDGAPIIDAMTSGLEMVIDLETGELTDDDVFGSKKPRAIGESWPIDSAAAAKSALEDGIEVDPAAITGTVTLEEVKTVQGRQCMVVTAKVAIDGAMPGPIPPGFALGSSKIAGTFHGLLPVDPKQPVLGGAMTLDMAIAISGQTPMGLASVDMTGKQSVRREITPLAKGGATRSGAGG